MDKFLMMWEIVLLSSTADPDTAMFDLTPVFKKLSGKGRRRIIRQPDLSFVKTTAGHAEGV